MRTIEQRILEELVYDRVRSTVNLCQLVIVEQELDENIQRAMERLGAELSAGAGAGAEGAEDAGAGAGDGAGGPGRKPGALTREQMQRAWERLEREWSALRKDLARAECAGCPGCAEGACDAP